MAIKGMGFFLQQIRNSSTTTSVVAKSETENNINNAKSENKRSSSVLEDKNVDDVEKLKIKKLDKSISYAFEVCLSQDELVFLKNEPVQILSDCFMEGTAPNFHFSKKIIENNYVRSCKWRPDGLMLFSESQDRHVRVFKFEDEKLKLHSKICSGDLIYDVQWHPNSDLFATTSKNHPIHLWSSDGKLHMSFRGINHLDELASAYSTAFSLDGQTLYAGYYKTLRIFNMERPGRQIKEIKTFEKNSITGGQKAILSCITSCPTMSGVYAVGCFAGTIGLYSDVTGQCDCLFSTENLGITHITYSSDGNLLFSGYRKSSVIECFDLRFPGHVLSKFYRPAATSQRFYFELDGSDRYLFSGSSIGKILIYDLKKSAPKSIQDTDTVKPHFSIFSGSSSVTGLSLHPFMPIIASTTGQRVFPKPLDSSSSDDSDYSLNNENYSSELQFSKNYVSYKHKKLENTLKLWKL